MNDPMQNLCHFAPEECEFMIGVRQKVYDKRCTNVDPIYKKD